MLAGFLLTAFGLGVAGYAWTFPAAGGQSVGPGFFPVVIGLALALGGLALAWSDRKATGVRWVEAEDWLRSPRLVWNAGLVVGVMIAYTLIVDILGFFLTALLFLVVLFLAFGVRRRWIPVVALGVTFGLHLAFYTFLRVPLPWGWFEGIAW